MKIFNLFNKNIVYKSFQLYKLIKLLSGWRTKYNVDQYDDVIGKAFTIINKFRLRIGKISPSFVLPDDQLSEDFIIRFFAAAKTNNYEVLSHKLSGSTKFNLIKK